MIQKSSFRLIYFTEVLQQGFIQLNRAGRVLNINLFVGSKKN